jgi:hypothetical protein
LIIIIITPTPTTRHALACRKYAQVGTRAEGNVRPADPAAEPEVTATPISQQLHTIRWGATQRVLAELVSTHADQYHINHSNHSINAIGPTISKTPILSRSWHDWLSLFTA